MAISWRTLHGDTFGGVRVLVTGGAGFIGSHLCTVLAGLGASVVALDDLSGGHRENLIGLANVELVEGLDPRSIAAQRVTAGCKFVLHQGALGSVPAIRRRAAVVS